MAVDQNRITKTLARGLKQHIERLVIRLVEAFDAIERLGKRNAPRINQLPLTDQTRHRAKPAGNARRLAVDERRQRLGKHARIEFIGFTVYIEKCARKNAP